MSQLGPWGRGKGRQQGGAHGEADGDPGAGEDRGDVQHGIDAQARLVPAAGGDERAQHAAECVLGLGVLAGLAGAALAVRVEVAVAVRVDHALLGVRPALEHRLVLDVDRARRLPPQHRRAAAAGREREDVEQAAPVHDRRGDRAAVLRQDGHVSLSARERSGAPDAKKRPKKSGWSLAVAGRRSLEPRGQGD